MGLFYSPFDFMSIVYPNGLMEFAAVGLVWLVPVLLLSLWFSTTETKVEAVFILTTILVSLVLSYMMGVLHSHPAPYMYGSHTLLSGPPENSFPSQHTTVMFAVGWPLFWLNRWRAGVISVGLALLVGFRRVYVGFHVPIDIVGDVVASLIGVALVYPARTPIRAVASRCVGIEAPCWTALRSD